jgi:hypothetical protein
MPTKKIQFDKDNEYEEIVQAPVKVWMRKEDDGCLIIEIDGTICDDVSPKAEMAEDILDAVRAHGRYWRRYVDLDEAE